MVGALALPLQPITTCLEQTASLRVHTGRVRLLLPLLPLLLRRWTAHCLRRARPALQSPSSAR